MKMTGMDELTQRECIIKNIHENVFVEAGAGAGKTTLIVSRIIEQLKSGMHPESIVVITFTNAAAEELRSRIIAKVREACKEETDADIRGVLEKALLGIDRMNISTIHSFCFKLLQERIFDAKLPMDVRLLEENEAQAKQENFFEDWVGRFTKADWKKFADYGIRAKEAVEDIRFFFMDMCELADDTVIRYDQTAVGKNLQNDAKVLVEDFQKVFCQAAAVLMGTNAADIAQIPDEMLMTKKSKPIREMLLLKEIPYFEVLKVLCAEASTKKEFFKKKITADKKVSLETEEGKCITWYMTRRADIEKMMALQEQYRYVMLLEYAIKAREEYRRQRTLRYVTNDDLLQRTHYLLCKSDHAEEVRAYFAAKYQCLYVDEFQDTDNIQEEFIWMLAAKKGEPEKLREGALFLVGDPKQSIYRFRGAQPEVYFRAKEKMIALENAKVYCLSYNFRSNDRIISWVNDRFGGRKISKEPYRGMEARKLLPEVPDKKLLAGVYHYGIQTGEVKKEDDAQCLGDLILRLVKQKYLITEYSKQDEMMQRAIAFSDFLILCNNKTDMDMYLAAMRERGIPVQINGSISLGENHALNTFVRLYDYLTHPFDRAKKTGALEALKEGGHMEAEKLLETVSKAVLQREEGRLSVYGAADYLMGRLELLLPVDQEISEGELLSVQTKLEQMYENVLSRKGEDTGEITEEFWSYIGTVLERELSLEESGDAVRFMNLHKAKGLEGNIVILAKRDEKMVFHEGTYRNGQDYYPAISKNFGRVRWSAYGHLPDVCAMAQQEESEEQTRLAYVAATRAKQVLIAMPPISKECMFKDYDLENTSVDIMEVVGQDALPETENGECAEYLVSDWQQAPREVAAVYEKRSPSSFEKASAVRQKAWAERKESYQPKAGRPKGNVFGTVMHRSLQLLIDRWGRNFSQGPGDLVGIIKSCASQAMMESRKDIRKEELPLYSSYLPEIMESFAMWAYEEGLFINARVYTEMPFSFYDPAFCESDAGQESLPVWMNGTADLIVVDEEGNYQILDYKSDHDGYLNEEEFAASLHEMYGGQLQQYRNAVQRLFGAQRDKISLRIISFDRDKKVRVTDVKPSDR